MKMFEDGYNRPRLLEEPFAQTLSGKTINKCMMGYITNVIPGVCQRWVDIKQGFIEEQVSMHLTPTQYMPAKHGLHPSSYGFLTTQVVFANREGFFHPWKNKKRQVLVLLLGNAK